jgi:hypothetical protein
MDLRKVRKLGTSDRNFVTHTAAEDALMGRWLDILKLEHSDIHLALFLTFGVVLLAYHFGLFPPLDAAPWWVIPLVGFGFILFGVLFALAALRAFLSTRRP